MKKKINLTNDDENVKKKVNKIYLIILILKQYIIY